MKNKLVRKYFLLAVTIVVLCLFLGLLASQYIAFSLVDKPERPNIQRMPPLFIAKTIDHIRAKNKIEALTQFMGWHDNEFKMHLSLYDEKFEKVYDSDSESTSEVKLSQDQIEFLQNPYDYIYLKSEKSDLDLSQRPEPPFMPILGWISRGPPPDRMMPPQNRGHGSEDIIVKLDGTPATYLKIGFGKMPPPSMMMKKDDNRRYFPLIGVASLVLSLFVGIGITLFVIYISVNKKVSEADEVISQIRSGNLKARFKIERANEFGEAMGRFNEMASEIEKLVEHLRFVELVRTKMLQELAHDLRTPITSIKSLVDTLNSNYNRLEPQVRSEMFELVTKEIDYFGQLVEDLLLLSQVSEPNYSVQNEQFNLEEIIQEEIDSTSSSQSFGVDRKEMIFNNHINHDVLMHGNTLLFKRMLRNLMVNALDFSKSKVIVDLKKTDQQEVIITISDDGPGMSEEQIQNFGHRRISRRYSVQHDRASKRLSIGLGSVIATKVAALHRGTIKVLNRADETHRVLGAQIEIKLSTKLSL